MIMEYGWPESILIVNIGDVNEKHRCSFLVIQIRTIKQLTFLLKLRHCKSALIYFHQMLISSLTYYYYFLEHLLHLSMRSEEEL